MYAKYKRECTPREEALVAAIVETKEKGKKLEDKDSSGSVGSKKRKKPEDEDFSGNEARDPHESDATWWIRKYQLRWRHRDELKQPSAWLGDEHINSAIDIS